MRFQAEFFGRDIEALKARQGYSRDHRPGYKQVLIALAAAKAVIPLGYEVFEGNRHDYQTVETNAACFYQIPGKSLERTFVL